MNTEELQKYESELNTCIRCAYCFEECPIFKELKWEVDGPRGKITLAYGLFSGELEPSQYIRNKIFECTYCKSCVENCSANVSIPDILTAARTDLVNEGFTYDAQVELIEKIKDSGNIFGKNIKAPVQEGETPVLLGCRLLERADDAKKYIEILEKLDIKPKIVDEICCGMPFSVLGFKDDLLKHKKEFKKAFPYKDFICLCTTCVFFIKQAYPELNPVYVIDVIEKKLSHYNTKKLGKEVTYHDPCNIARGLNMVEKPRNILKEIGVNLKELPTNGKNAECCGGGGGLLVTNKPLSEKLALNRIKQAAELDIDTLVTLCPTCEFNLGNALEKINAKFKVKNMLDLVWESLQ